MTDRHARTLTEEDVAEEEGSPSNTAASSSTAAAAHSPEDGAAVEVVSGLPPLTPEDEEEEEDEEDDEEDDTSMRGIPPEEMSDFSYSDGAEEEDEDGDVDEADQADVEGVHATLDLLHRWHRWRRLRMGRDATEDGDENEENEEEEGEEEGEDEQPGEEGQRGRRGLNYDRTQPTEHSYLGDDLDAIAGRTFLPPAHRMVLPIFPLNGIVLLPGETLPLRLFSDAYVSLLQRLRDKGSSEGGDAHSTLGVVNIAKVQRAPSQTPRRPEEEDITHRLARMGTTAEIRSVAKQPSGDGAVNALTVGRQRFRILRAWMNNVQHMIYADVMIISDDEPTTLPRGAFISLGGHYTSMPLVTSSSQDIENVEQSATTTSTSGRQFKLTGQVMGALPQLGGRRVISAGWHPLWVYRLYDSSALAQRAKAMFDELIIEEGRSTTSSSSSSAPSIISAAKDPVSYSFWLAANLPLDDIVRQELLEINCTADRLRREMEIMKTYNTICCRRCGRVVGGSKDVFCMSLEGPVSAYVNPSGYVHQTITLRRARGLRLEGNPSAENSWFPGYAWTIAYCSRCFNHMGWRFTAVSPGLRPHTFYGLSRASITHAPPPSTDAEPNLSE